MKSKYLVLWVIVTLILMMAPVLANADYDSVKDDALDSRQLLVEQYHSDGLDEQLLTQASLKIQQLVVDEFYPFWDGTTWAYNGTTQEPGQGEIACGYFVTTLLRDAGVKLERAGLAQQASENIIKSLVSSASIRRFSDKSSQHVVNNLMEWGDGLYIVGLDNHVGFISVEDDQAYFIHSSYVAPSVVLKEDAMTSLVLAASRYRVVGKLSDKKFIGQWLAGKKFITIGKS